jgi:murein DD-endopeptidase MepM/ murein hydrolase activator NlpD
VQISELESEVKTRDAELSRLNRQFAVLEELEEKLRTVAGLKPRDRSKIELAEGGQGGPDDDTQDEYPSLVASAEATSAAVTDFSAQELITSSLELQDSFTDILNALERQGEELASIPSINPVASQEAWPSSGFGYSEDPINGKTRFHEGVDIVAPRGTPVIAPADGVVVFSGWDSGLGRMIVIAHGYGYSTAYGHCNSLLVRKGDQVRRGDVIAYVGSSGRSTGPHLHYEVRRNGRVDNPYNYLVQ